MKCSIRHQPDWSFRSEFPDQLIDLRIQLIEGADVVDHIRRLLDLLLDGGGIVEAIAGANTAAASVTPSDAGSFKLRLTVQDGAGAVSTADLRVQVAEAPPDAPAEDDIPPDLVW